MIYACYVSSFLNFCSSFLVRVYNSDRHMCLHCVSSHVVPFFLHAISSYIIHGIIVIESSEVEPVEPTKSVEPEPGVQFVVEPEVNQGKQLSMIPCSYLI